MMINQQAMKSRQFFLDSKLTECINYVDEIQVGVNDFQSYKYCQIYKGLSFFELSLQEQGQKCFQDLIQLSQEKSQNNADELDIIIQILYQWQNFDEEQAKAKKNNENLLMQCEKYKELYGSKENYNEYIYLFGISVYNFIDYYPDKKNCEYLDNLVQNQSKIQQFNQESIILIGWMYDYLNQHDEARKWYKVLEEINPRYPGLANNIALTYEQKNEQNLAEEYLLKAVEICPQNAVILTNLALHYQNSDQKQKAIEFFEKSFEANPKFINCILCYSKLMISNQDTQKAREILLKGNEINQKNVDILLHLMSLEAEVNNFEIAQQYLNQVLEINPNEGFPEYKYGSLLFDKNQYDLCETQFLRCLNKNLSPHFVGYAISKLAYSYFSQYKFIDSFQQLMKLGNLDIPNFQFQEELDGIGYILDEIDAISLQQKVSILNSYYGIIQTRYGQIKKCTQSQFFKCLLEFKSDNYRNIVSIIAYQRSIQNLLTFKQSFNHWDLFLS